MKFLFLLCTLAMSVLTISCTTELTDQNAVSDAWLDTAPRVSQRPHRPADGLTDWKLGPSIDRIAGYPSKGVQVIAARETRPAEVAPSKQTTARPETHYISSGYTTHYGGSYHGHSRAPNPGFVRTVETVGPPIVPRLSVPTTIRSPQAASAQSYASNHTSNRKDSHQSRYNRAGRNTANTAANDGRSRGGQGSQGGRRR